MIVATQITVPKCYDFTQALKTIEALETQAAQSEHPEVFQAAIDQIYQDNITAINSEF